MNRIVGQSRQQVEFGCLEDAISPDNSVRVMDAFVDKLDLNKLGFVQREIKSEGRPAFENETYLKIYLYGYVNGIRSSRKLERECTRNIELQWLTGKLNPNYHSIADFRKNNPSALRNLFKLFVTFLKDIDLIGGATIAVDGTKVRANNSKKNNFSPKKIERHIEYIEQKSNEYLAALETSDAEEDQVKISDVEKKLQRLKENKINYELLQTQLEESGEPQISTTDADSRALLVQGQVVEIAYNMQAAVDDKYNLIVATHTINRNDRNALSKIALEAKENLNIEAFTVLVDKGYHNGRELQTCKENSIETICAHAEVVNSNTHGTTPAYLVTKFFYNSQDDTYTCPQGSVLKTTGTWHKKSRERDSHLFKKYRTPECKTCPVKSLCTGRADGGREIDRSEYAQAVEENATRYKINKVLYRKRQEINEHIFGTIKRKWSYYYTDLRGLEKVNGEHSFICFVYNFIRAIKIESVNSILEKIKNWEPNYRAIVRLMKILINYDQIRLIKFRLRAIYSCEILNFRSIKMA
jgi:transposase